MKIKTSVKAGEFKIIQPILMPPPSDLGPTKQCPPPNEITNIPCPPG